MKTERCQASAVSVGDNLIVAGGFSSSSDDLDDFGALDIVEVYDGHQWRRAKSLPRKCWCMKSAVFEGNWYLAGGTRQGCKVYYTSLESLIATSERARQISAWKKPPDAPLQWSTLAVFGNQLITLGGGYNKTSAVHAYSQSWVHVGDLPVACYSPCTLVLPTGELLLLAMGTESGPESHLFRAKVGGDLDMCIDGFHGACGFTFRGEELCLHSVQLCAKYRQGSARTSPYH